VTPYSLTTKYATMVTAMAAVDFQNGIMANGVVRASIAFVLCSLAVLAGILVPAPAGAADGFGITGSFSSQSFEIPQGGSAYGPSIDIIVYNHTAQAFKVQTTAVAVNSDNVPEPGINISLTQHDFVLAAGADQKIVVGVSVGVGVAPGQYRLSVTANQLVDTPSGPVVGLAVGEDTWLTVSGYSASVSVNTVGTSGQPVVSIVRLWRLTDAGIRNNEVAYSNTGSLQALVAPGRYVASAYSISTSDLLTEQESEVVAGDEKTITLMVETVSFESFAVNEFRNSQTGELGWAQMVYTVLNNYQSLDNASIRLVVYRNAALLEEVVIWGPLTLPTGRTGAPYNYIPSNGRWRGGLYTFKLQLYVNDQLWAGTNEVTLDVAGGGAKSWLWIVFVILGILGTGGLGFLIFFLWKRRKKEEEKPTKAEKKKERRKEEKPVPKAPEPVRKPEPFRPAEHLRPPEPAQPVEPVRYEEPTVEPTVEPVPLASVSTLKARMASLGRDQGTGEVAEEEPSAEKKDKPVETGPQASAVGPVPPPAKIEPERPAGKKVEKKVQKPPASEKPAGHKPGIFSKVTATGKKEPPKPPSAQGPAPVKPENEIQINWPPKSEEPPKPPSDVQINWPPKPVEPPKPSSFAEAARQRAEAQQRAGVPEEAAPAEEAAGEEPGEPQSPPSKSSFAEAARLRMEARQRAGEADKTGAGPEESQTEGDDAGKSGEGEDNPPST